MEESQIKPTDPTSVSLMFVVILVAAMKHEERRACGEVGKTSIALPSTTYVFSESLCIFLIHTNRHVYILTAFDNLAATLVH